MNILSRALKNADLTEYTNFRLPGTVKLLLAISRPEELIEAIQAAKKDGLPYFIIAGGCNIVTAEESYPGLVIIYREQKNNSKSDSLKINGYKISAFGSVALWDIVDLALVNNLAGLEKLTGIPGNLSGAIYGNAGAYGRSIADVIDRVEIFDGVNRRWLSRGECQFTYRDSIFKREPWVILSAELELRPGEAEELKKIAESLNDIRTKKFSNLLCPGSFFKNVLVKDISTESLAKIDQTKIIDGKIPAGYLLENVGAKGLKHGGLEVADYHGNLIINNGTATAREVTELAQKLKDLVLDKYGIALEEEVRYLR